MSNPAAASLLSLILLGWSVSPLARGETLAIQGRIPPRVQEIEVVYAGAGNAPEVLLKSTLPASPLNSLRLADPHPDLLDFFTDVRAFGGCRSAVHEPDARLVLETIGQEQGPCGFVLSLPAGKPGLDVLSYASLFLRGETSAPVTLALSDQAAGGPEDSVPLADLRGRFERRLPLAPAGQRLDLRHLTGLTLLAQAPRSRIVLSAAALERAGRPRQQPPALGFWLWEYRDALARSDEILATCRAYGCTRLAVQMPALADPPSLWRAYAQFLAAGRERGVEALALDGYPEAIDDLRPLLDKLRRLDKLMPEGLAGVQVDIEPYLLPAFAHDPEAGFARYLTAIERIRTALSKRTRLSVVMPFWFTAITVEGRPVAFSVMDLADEVTIMSYRTDREELRAVADDALRYGDLAGVPVWLAVETVTLPLERHLVLKPESRRELADAYLNRRTGQLVLEPPPAGIAPADRFRIHHRITVRPERITFAGQTRGRVQAAVATLMETLPNPSLTGVMIHDFHHFLHLPE